MSQTLTKLTPMFEQYLEIKSGYPNALLFYRMGDFYELFFDDALTASRELQIALTSRNKESENAVPMCGVPWHAAQSYISQLIARGYNVAICEQVENPQQAKGLVKREVTQVITPGTILDSNNLDSRSHNFLGAFFPSQDNEGGGFAWADASTGEWSGIHSKNRLELLQWIQKISPRELLLPEKYDADILNNVEQIKIVHTSHQLFDLKSSKGILCHLQQVQEMASLGLDGKDELVRACGALVCYLEKTQQKKPDQLLPFMPLDLSRHLVIDEITEKNLELFVRLNGQKGKGTLRDVIDQTITPMGARMLEERLRCPWRDCGIILKNQECVIFFQKSDGLRNSLREILNGIHDMERLIVKISFGRALPRDYILLRNTLVSLPKIPLLLHGKEEKQQQLPPAIQALLETWDSLEDCSNILDALVDDPPNTISEGGLFKHAFNDELDRLFDLLEHSEQKLHELLGKEQRETGIAKIKIGYNRVFGYYYEIPKGSVPDTMPSNFIRRQSLANAERFTTESLKALEEDLLSATDKRNSLEYDLFQNLRERIASQRERLIHIGHMVACIDYWQSLAHVARLCNWCCPEIVDKPLLEITEGRHPVVEKMIGEGNFVPNNFSFDENRKLCIITGPNMAGKSTALRQIALICLLAHMGSMVPATTAKIGIVDRIFSRIGASDNLAQGQSTFMVEMMETARILRQASSKSLVILDEIGRGTSTYDGLAIAWAVVEDLARRFNGEMRTLFATHYHELTSLEGKLPTIFTMNIAICEQNGEILFLHKLIPGPSDRSYGIEVAKLAGIPTSVIQRARTILSHLENEKNKGHNSASVNISLPGIPLPKDRNQAKETVSHKSLLPIINEIQAINPENITPLDALRLVNDWKALLGKNCI